MRTRHKRTCAHTVHVGTHTRTHAQTQKQRSTCTHANECTNMCACTHTMRALSHTGIMAGEVEQPPLSMPSFLVHYQPCKCRGRGDILAPDQAARQNFLGRALLRWAELGKRMCHYRHGIDWPSPTGVSRQSGRYRAGLLTITVPRPANSASAHLVGWHIMILDSEMIKLKNAPEHRTIPRWFALTAVEVEKHHIHC